MTTPASRTLVVRPIRDHEVAALSRITLEAYATLPVDVGDYRATLADVADRVRHATVLVAVDAATRAARAAAQPDAVLGGVTYVPDAGSRYAEFSDPDGAGIRMLAVAPEARGRGAGAALIAACVALAREQGRRRVVLHTTAAMVAAQHLYARHGFVRAPARDWTPQPGVALLGYELVLDGR